MTDTVDPKSVLAEGRLIEPVDLVTAGGYELWKDSPPMYHDLSCMPYTKYDVQEWSSRIKKYKVEMVRYVDLCRRLEKEVEDLQLQVSDSSSNFEEAETKIVASQQRLESTEDLLSQEIARRNLNAIECASLKRSRADALKHKEVIEKDIERTRSTIGVIQTEIEFNRKKHLSATGEKEHLNLERRWFFHERLLLEETTLKELQDIAIMKEKVEKLRFCMQQAWKDAKETDVWGHARATKKTAYGPDWYAARKRTFNRVRQEGGTVNYAEAE